MEKWFTSTKWFVCFCGAFIVVWVVLQVIINFHLTVMAQLDSQRILGWRWPSKRIRSRAEVKGVEVVNRTSTDAVVDVKLKQTVQQCDSHDQLPNDLGSPTDCQAKLTYYKANQNWFLGKVELR